MHGYAKIAGAGKVIGLDNGNQRDPTPLYSTVREPYRGRLLAIVEAGETAGEIILEAKAPGLIPVEVSLPRTE